MKITIIGAGSSYTPELIEGLINNYKYLNFTELCLHDLPTSEYKFNTIYEFTKRMFIKQNIKINVTKVYDKIDAIKNSSFVIIQLRVGLLEARINDELIPIKYGMLGQETNGIGGMFKAFRTIPVIFEIVDLVKKYAPKAWIINFSNPAGIVTEAVHSYKKFKRFVGVCNVAVHLEMLFAQFYNIDCTKISINWIGLNHFIFGTKVLVNNIDKTQESITAFVDPKNVEGFTMRNVLPIPWEPYFVKSLNLIPCPYFRYFVKYQDMVSHMVDDYKKNSLRSQQVKETETKLFKLYENVDLKDKPKELEWRGGAFYSKIAIEVLTALYGGPKKIHAVNYPNNGTIKNFPKSSVLEVSSLISKNKIKQLKEIKYIPKKVEGMIINLKKYENIVIDAAINGDYELGLVATNVSPFSRSDVINKKMYDELLEINREYLPNFFKK